MPASNHDLSAASDLLKETENLNHKVQSTRVDIYCLLNLPLDKRAMDAQMRFAEGATDDQKEQAVKALVPLYRLLDSVQNLGDKLRDPQGPDLKDPIYKALVAMDETRKRQLIDDVSSALPILEPNILSAAKTSHSKDKDRFLSGLEDSLDAIILFGQRNQATVHDLAPSSPAAGRA